MLEDVIVTAQKRAQSSSDVGLSITSVGATLLEQHRVDDTFEVAKLVPGLSVSQVGTGTTTTFTLRGIGFNSAALGASPAVAVYVDEVPLAYPAMTNGAVFDLERLEVYKGPQGIFYGQNSTGGAINFIANRPTDEFHAGFDASYGRFKTWTTSGFVSGPVSDTVKLRLAVSHEGSNDWQYSYFGGVGTHGAINRSAARLTADFDPTSALRFEFRLNGWTDYSDSQALQLVKVVPKVPKYLNAQLAVYPLPPDDARAASWEFGKPWQYNTSFWQPSLRTEWDIHDNLTLTAITTFSHYETDSTIDNDGTNLQDNSMQYYGSIRAFSQEVRLSGNTDALRWTVGADYSKDKIVNGILQDTFDSSNAQNVAGYSIGVAPVRIYQNTESNAIFTNAEIKYSNQWTLVGGARYTKTDIDFHGCNLGQGYPAVPNTPVPGVTQSLEGLFNTLYQAFSGNVGVNPVQQGGCVTLNALNGTFLPTDSPQSLDQSNVSANITLDYKPLDDVLVYGLVSQGYKAGSFPLFGASSNVQYLPAKQEKVRAYEIGSKLAPASRAFSVEGAVFYYDYSDKQLSGYILDPIFGPLEALVNVPKSDIKGAEVAASWVPLRGLTLSASATYVATKIKEFTGVNSTGATQNFQGDAFNLSPKWFGNVDVLYRRPINENLDAIVGAGSTSRSKTSGVVGSNDSAFDIRAYTLLDAQLGVEQHDGKWNVKLWGKNLTNVYYWNNTSYTADIISRLAGMPVTYGVSAGYRF